MGGIGIGMGLELGWDGHLHVKELDGDIPVPVACMHCGESTRPNLVA